MMMKYPAAVNSSLFYLVISLSCIVLFERFVNGYSDDDSDDNLSFGAFGTLNSLIHWSIQEEATVELLSKERIMLLKKRELIHRFLEKFPIFVKQNFQTVSKQIRGLIWRQVESLHPFFRIQGIGSWLGRVEMFMSMDGFLHTQQVYGFKADKMQTGLVFDSFFGSNLKPSQSAEMGTFALFRNYYYMAVDWLEEAAVAAQQRNRDLFEMMLLVATQEHNKVWTRPQHEMAYQTYMNTFTDPVSQETKPFERNTERQRIYYQHARETNWKRNSKVEAQFMTLCSSSTQGPTVSKSGSKLKCFYKHKENPYLYIAPVKIEQLSVSPPIYLYYDIIGNETAEEMKRLYEPLVKPSKFWGYRDLENLTHIRTSVSAFVNDSDIPEKVFLLAGIITGLKFVGAPESSQYTVYTYGRFINYHTDNLEDRMHGDRVATMLYYLEVPDLGGDTAFCQAGVYASPRNSAIFWHNLYRNGSKRVDVEHGSCPVIHGHKIILTQWIRYNDNWQHYKCSLDRND